MGDSLHQTAANLENQHLYVSKLLSPLPLLVLSAFLIQLHCMSGWCTCNAYINDFSDGGSVPSRAVTLVDNMLDVLQRI